MVSPFWQLPRYTEVCGSSLPQVSFDHWWRCPGLLSITHTAKVFSLLLLTYTQTHRPALSFKFDSHSSSSWVWKFVHKSLSFPWTFSLFFSYTAFVILHFLVPHLRLSFCSLYFSFAIYIVTVFFSSELPKVTVLVLHVFYLYVSEMGEMENVSRKKKWGWVCTIQCSSIC